MYPLLRRELHCLDQQDKLREEVETRVNEKNREPNLHIMQKATRTLLGPDDEDAVIEKFRERLRELRIPSKISDVIQEELGKLSSLHFSSSEYGVTRNYVDWLTSMPWGFSTEDNLNLEDAKCILDQDHYGLDDVKERVLEFIAVRQLRDKSSKKEGKILCFVGAPGVGKT